MFTKLLVPLDRSSLAEQAIGHASSIARACHAGVDVVLMLPTTSPRRTACVVDTEAPLASSLAISRT